MKSSIFLFLFISCFLSEYAQTANQRSAEENEVIQIASDMMIESGLCALITHDTSGKINARMMEPFSPEEDLIVWFGTNTLSRKVQDIKANPDVTLYYASSDASGYIVLHGHAFLVDDAALKQQYWMQSWEDFYEKDRSNYLLIKVIPDSMEILSTKHGITGDTITWRVPSINLK